MSPTENKTVAELLSRVSPEQRGMIEAVQDVQKAREEIRAELRRDAKLTAGSDWVTDAGAADTELRRSPVFVERQAMIGACRRIELVITGEADGGDGLPWDAIIPVWTDEAAGVNPEAFLSEVYSESVKAGVSEDNTAGFVIPVVTMALRAFFSRIAKPETHQILCPYCGGHASLGEKKTAEASSPELLYCGICGSVWGAPDYAEPSFETENGGDTGIFSDASSGESFPVFTGTEPLETAEEAELLSIAFS